MGFYRERKKREISRQGRFRTRPSMHLVAVAVFSALAGSGVTLATMPALSRHGTTAFASTGTFGQGALSAQSTLPVASLRLRGSDGIVQAVRQVSPAVFGVVNYASVSDFFTQRTKLQPAGVGTGVLFWKNGRNGFVVTNNHVVEGASKVELVLASGKHIHASVVGTDPYTDLAVLRVAAADVKNIQPAPFANSDAIEVGEQAIAIGTPMGLDFTDTVTAGIVSAKNRIMPVEDPQNQNMVLDYQAVIQTDAAINPGNSGGPLLNIKGQVIGINSSKIAAQMVEGMGFSIPSNEVRAIAEQIMQTGHAVHPSLGITGYSLATLPEQLWPDVPIDYGVYVQSVTAGSVRKAGLQPQDVIVGINKHTVKSMADLRTYLFQLRPGDHAALRVYRGGRELTVQTVISKMETANDAGASPSSTQESTDPFETPSTFGD
ncbi:S1C family serine protease [Alicyclobacillus sp. ALC3]|uniref:S1C family serine protease n=1 Tax=Alicyclobacillus sp. ALC3 TaxID=2796143 RepID=UPI002377FF7E|nr:trypsin-like peptidase domain-containing protein [Alicyclobacillus sp. ALC3]